MDHLNTAEKKLLQDIKGKEGEEDTDEDKRLEEQVAHNVVF